jgi:hypothetical protein
VEGTDPAAYREIIEEYGEDSDEARVEVYGLFPQDDDVSFISHSLVEKAVNRSVVDDRSAPVVIGIDPARSGADWFVIYVRQGRQTVAVRRFKLDDSEMGTMEGVGHVIDAIEEYQPTLAVIDEGGLGGPILDRLREQRYKVKGVNFAWKSKHPQRWGNKRAEMWGEMKKWLATGSIPDDKRLKSDLIAPRKKPDSKGVMFLESKKDMRGRGVASPDSADALAITFAFPVANREYNGKRATKRVGDDGFAGATSFTGWLGN